MRLRTSMSVTLCVAAIGLALTGCSASRAGRPATTSPANPVSTTRAGGATPTPASSQPVAGSGSRCRRANLSFSLGASMAEPGTGQWTQVVDLTNESPSACTMTGFPGVDLVGVADGQQNYTWPLTRASANYASASNQGISTVTLQPGATAHFEVRYHRRTPGDGSSLLEVAKIVITPPNDYTQAALTWHQDVVLQDAATHPGTYLMPVVSGS